MQPNTRTLLFVDKSRDVHVLRDGEWRSEKEEQHEPSAADVYHYLLTEWEQYKKASVR